MDYKKIHDCIINRARQRNFSQEKYMEQHHVIPKCEGGLLSGETVGLSLKEHRIVHLLRFKITKNIGNKIAYNLMLRSEKSIKESRVICAKIGANSYHTDYKNKNPDDYRKNQINAGKSGGNKCKIHKKGFFSLSEPEKVAARDKGRKTLVRNKIGMFSDEYRSEHRKRLQKTIITPDGVFSCMLEAARFYKKSPATITYRVNSDNYSEWKYYNEKGEKK